MNASALRQLYFLMCAIPATEINLNLFYMRSSGSGCVWGCGLGYAAKFNLCGLYLEPGVIAPEYMDHELGIVWKGIFAAAKAFGISNQQALDLFGAAHKSRYDGASSDHKNMWLHRMECFFEEHGLSLDEPKEVQHKDTPALV